MKVTQELKETHIPRQVGFAETPKHSQIGLQQRKADIEQVWIEKKLYTLP